MDLIRMIKKLSSGLSLLSLLTTIKIKVKEDSHLKMAHFTYIITDFKRGTWAMGMV